MAVRPVRAGGQFAMNDQPKFCRDCLHCMLGSARNTDDKRLEYAKCASSARPETDLVSGITKTHIYYCSVARNNDLLCGQSAKWFEPKQS